MSVALAQNMSRKERRELLKRAEQKVAEVGAALDKALERLRSVHVTPEDLEEELDGHHDR